MAINKFAVCYRNKTTGNTSVDWKVNFKETRRYNPDNYIVLDETFCKTKKQYAKFVNKMKKFYTLARS